MTHTNDQDPDPIDLALEKSANCADLIENPLEGMPPIKKTRETRALSRADQAFELRISGLSYQKIAQALDVSVSTVHRAVQSRLQAIARRMATETGPALLVQELERLDKLLAVALDRATGGPMLDKDGEPVLDKDGDPRFYEPDHRWAMRAQELIKTRAELLGLTKTRIELTGADGGPVESRSVKVNLDNMTPAQIAALEIMFSRMGVSVPGLTPASAAPALAPSSVVDAEIVPENEPADATSEPESDD